MFKFLRVMVLLGLFAAVAGFGLKIYLASSRMDTPVATDTSKLKESLKESMKKVKKLARKKTGAIKKMMDSVLNSLPQETKRKSKPEEPFDFERVSKIQEIYTQATRALSLD